MKDVLINHTWDDTYKDNIKRKSQQKAEAKAKIIVIIITTAQRKMIAINHLHKPEISNQSVFAVGVITTSVIVPRKMIYPRVNGQ